MKELVALQEGLVALREYGKRNEMERTIRYHDETPMPGDGLAGRPEDLLAEGSGAAVDLRWELVLGERLAQGAYQALDLGRRG